MFSRTALTRHWWTTLSLVLGGLLLTACTRTTAFATEPHTVIAEVNVTPIITPHTPTGITIVALAKATPRVTATARPVNTGSAVTQQVILQGRIYDAGQGQSQRLDDATLDWQFFAADRQSYNGSMAVSADGLYRLVLPIRASDEVVITAHAPGYLPSTAHIHGNQLSSYGSRLNFGLISDEGGAPTLPGDLGSLQLRGIVYNGARGVKSPIDQATIDIINYSIVQPVTQIEVTTNLSGTFDLTLKLHTTDRIDFTITAAGYQTSTLSKNAKDLVRNPQFLIGLRPAPKSK